MPDLVQPRSTLPAPDAVHRAIATRPRDMLCQAPAMPPEFYGTVVYRYRAGKARMVELAQTFTADEEPRR